MYQPVKFCLVDLVKTIGDQTVFILIKPLFQKIQIFFRAVFSGISFQKSAALPCFSDIQKKIPAPLRCTLDALPVLSDHFPEFLIISIQTALFKLRCLIAYKRCQGTALGDHGLRRISYIIVIEMWNLSHQLIRPAASGHAVIFSGQKFQCAVGAEVDHGVRLKSLTDPVIKGLIFPGRLPVPVVISSRIPAFSLRVAKGLQSQKNISHTDPPDGIFFSLKLPGDPSFPFLAPLGQVAVSACDKHFLKLFGRASLCIIAGLFQPLKQSGCRGKGIQKCSSEHIALPRGIIIEDHRQPLLFPFFLSKFQHPGKARHKGIDPLRYGFQLWKDRFFSLCASTSHDPHRKRKDPAVQLRKQDADKKLSGIHGIRPLPFLPGNSGQAEGFEIGNIQFFQDFHRLHRISTHGPCTQAEGHQIDHCRNRCFLLREKCPQFLQIPVLILGKCNGKQIVPLSQFLCQSLYYRQKIIGIGMSVKKQGHGFPLTVKIRLLPEFRRCIPGFHGKRIFQIDAVLHGTGFLLREKFSSAVLPEDKMHKRFHICPGGLLPVIDQKKHVLHIPGDSKRQHISHHHCHPPHPVHFCKCTGGRFFLTGAGYLCAVGSGRPGHIPGIFFPAGAFHHFSHGTHGKRTQADIVPKCVSNDDPMALTGFEAFYHDLLKLFGSPHGIHHRHICRGNILYDPFRFQNVSLFLSRNIETDDGQIILRVLLFITFPECLDLPESRYGNRCYRNLHKIPSPVCIDL